jgi:predicted lipoprotein with Yx(FWY)xxD motif
MNTPLHRTRIRASALLALTFAVGLGIGLMTATASPTSPTVRTERIGGLGSVIVNAAGRTLYHDGHESSGHLKCVGACARIWPPLLIPAGAKPLAGPGVSRSLLGTIKRPGGGGVQVTYRGMALYRYVHDTKAGEASGQGAGGIWHAITPAGAIDTKTPSATSTTPTSTTPTSTTSTYTTPTYTTVPGGSGSTGATTTNDCATNPGGNGCM